MRITTLILAALTASALKLKAVASEGSSSPGAAAAIAAANRARRQRAEAARQRALEAERQRKAAEARRRKACLISWAEGLPAAATDALGSFEEKAAEQAATEPFNQEEVLGKLLVVQDDVCANQRGLEQAQQKLQEQLTTHNSKVFWKRWFSSTPTLEMMLAQLEAEAEDAEGDAEGGAQPSYKFLRETSTDWNGFSDDRANTLKVKLTKACAQLHAMTEDGEISDNEAVGAWRVLQPAQTWLGESVVQALPVLRKAKDAAVVHSLWTDPEKKDSVRTTLDQLATAQVQQKESSKGTATFIKLGDSPELVQLAEVELMCKDRGLGTMFAGICGTC